MFSPLLDDEKKNIECLLPSCPLCVVTLSFSAIYFKPYKALTITAIVLKGVLASIYLPGYVLVLFIPAWLSDFDVGLFSFWQNVSLRYSADVDLGLTRNDNHPFFLKE